MTDLYTTSESCELARLSSMVPSLMKLRPRGKRHQNLLPVSS